MIPVPFVAGLMHPTENEFLQQKKEFLKFLGIPLLPFLYTPLMQKGTERNVQPRGKLMMVYSPKHKASKGSGCV